MSVMTYSGLIAAKTVSTSLRYWLNYDLIPVDDIITDAQSFVYSNLRCREMETSISIPVTTTTAYVDLPAGFLDPIALFQADGTEIYHYDSRNHMKVRSLDTTGVLQSGYVSLFAIYDERIYFDVLPEEASSFTLLYYKRPDPLVAATNESNWLTARYPKLFRCALLAEAYEFRKDAQQAQYYRAMSSGLIEAANAEADLVHRGRYSPRERYDA